jgi:metallo-beta-lactamase family protein
MPSSLRFLGANRQVTGSCYLLEIADLRILIDCGMFQERQLLERNWEPKPVDPAHVDWLLVTHAHLDHTGLIPRLVRDGFSSPILTTAPTVELAELVLRDSARLQEEDAAFKAKRHLREGRRGPHPAEPLYTVKDVEKVLPLLRGTGFRTPVQLNGKVAARFLEAGHILGAASIELTVRENGAARKLVFSGDLGPPQVPIVPEPAVIDDADLLILESTYGDRDHPSRATASAALAEAIVDTLERGGNVLIPTFAIERAQELLLELGALIGSGRIPPVRVFLDSPMAADATAIYLRYPEFMDEETRRTIESKELETARRMLTIVRTGLESRALNPLRGCVILAGSGMCTGGRIKHHLREHISRPESTIVFAGYQSEGTLGRRILDGYKEVRLFGEQHTVRARVVRIDSLSGHADRGQLVQWLSHLRRRPSTIALTHGEEEASVGLSERIREGRGWDVLLPQYGQKIEI